jgi:ligand-binding sensor domain-containing protein/two-component sensor histidine kinase
MYLYLPVRSQEYQFQRLTMQDGLPSDYVMAILADKEGICWIGTDKGLCWFDGATTSVISMDDGLPGNHITALNQDKAGNIWVGTSYGGVSLIEKAGRKYIIKKTYSKGLHVRRLTQDTLGRYWIIAATPGSATVTLFTTTNLSKTWQPIVNVSNISQVAVDSSGKIWLTTSYPAKWHQTGWPSRIISTTQWGTNTQIAASGSRVAVWNHREAIVYNTMQPTDSTKIIFKSIKDGQFPLRYLSHNDADIFYKTINGLQVYKNGGLQHSIDYKTSEKNLLIFEAIHDKHDQLLISDFGNGLVFWRPPYARIYHAKNPLRRIAIHSNAVSYSTEKEITIITNDGKVSTTNHAYASPVNFHAVDNADRLIVVGFNIIYNAKGLPVYNNMVRFNDFSDMLSLGDTNYISSYSWGLFRSINGRLDSVWKKSLGMPPLNIERLRQYGDFLYCLTLSAGLWRIHLPTKRVEHFGATKGLPSTTVYDVMAEADTTWIATAKGLTIMNEERLHSLGKANGFDGNRALCVFRDKQNRLWVLSDTYLHLYIKNRLYPIQSQPVLIESHLYPTTARFQYATNTLWVGTNRGMLAIQMDSINPMQFASTPRIAGIWEGNNRNITIDENRVEIPWNHRPIKVQLTNTHISRYTKPIVRIKLSGFNNDWLLLDNDLSTTFTKLPIGNYKLEIQTIGPDLARSPVETIMSLTVLPPWWKRGTFILCSFIALGIAIIFISRHIYTRKFRQKLKAIEAQQALQQERLRISRELHDNIGSMLTLMINRIEDNPAPSEMRTAGISGIARYTLAQLRDAIWALDKESLTLYQWVIHTNEYLKSMPGDGNGFKSQFSWNEEVLLSPLHALHSFRILQEAVTNALKHAKATEIVISGKQKGQTLMLEVYDNGPGFNKEEVKLGYGLRNMQKRAKEMGGFLKVESISGFGTTIILQWEAD